MAHWELEPRGVYDVLRKVGSEVAEVGEDVSEDKVKSLSNAVVGADTNTAFGYVAVAANNLIEAQLNNIQTIQVRMNAGVIGVSNALIAYVRGQRDMQNTFNTEMLKTAESGDFEFFRRHSLLPQTEH